MADWVDKLNSLAESLTKGLDSLTKLGLFPPDFEQQSSAYQLAWLDQQIPLYEKSLANMEVQAQNSAAVAVAKSPRPSYKDVFSGQVSESELHARLRGDSELLKLETTRQQLIQLKAKRAALQTLLPASPPAKPSRQQLIAQLQAELSDIHKQKADMRVFLQKLPNVDQTTLDASDRNFDDQIQKLMDKMSKL